MQLLIMKKKISKNKKKFQSVRVLCFLLEKIDVISLPSILQNNMERFPCLAFWSTKWREPTDHDTFVYKKGVWIKQVTYY
jgi:hypothetical protein